jgi:hypothetical protein
MLKYYVWATETARRLRHDAKGVVSFEYVILVACIVAASGTAFNTGTSGLIGTTLTNAIIVVCAALGAVMGG